MWTEFAIKKQQKVSEDGEKTKSRTVASRENHSLLDILADGTQKKVNNTLWANDHRGFEGVIYLF